MLTILFSAPPARWPQYQAPLTAALQEAGIAARIVTETEAPETVDYVVYAPNGGLSDFTPFTGCRAVLSLWAGVENIVTNDTLTQPLCRMVDAGLEEGMREWVAGHVLRHHLGMDAHIVNPAHRWDQVAPPLARDRTVALLGLGALGQAAASALVALGFDVQGWSRTQREVPGVTCHHGAEGLRAVLERAEIAVLLLPLTAQTENLMNAERLGWMPAGAVLINPGRGALIDDTALLAALDAGRIGHATLDVFRSEPLPADHPFWTHPRVTVTPHIASETRPASAARVIAENIRRSEAGEPLLHLVDRARGY
ncbi:2-hydroxyacid dehydrogenase [Rhodovulum adriaticum]|uniref:Glyoxylate/hydroxypyruvate reductase A n=1 Tax=Rhodovulum adriaticum TaxID=35804 RepID=A0A4R2NJC0_RHOAD|nr:glyoxylate/hydroxypyruvate reductase A [Rhodovulum adriaticum]MBK1634734.1 glyoxylate/hydroxypyruvate reductase A [Rhodovulum adriaticum]TCP21557.1 glyoxylate/hydroxypyruvate reductase A [Rhodovulum adriaticum]